MNIPKTWTLTQLGSLTAQIVGGGTPSKTSAANFNGHIPFMTVKDLKARFVSSTVDHISEDALQSSATTKVPADTLIVATRMSLGKIARPTMDVAINQDLKALFLHGGVNKTFVEYFWRSKSQAIQSMGTGTTVKGIRLEDIRTLEVPLAPLAEQKRIADKLDTVLTRVDAVNSRLARVAPLLKRFRQSVLAAATSGRLTEDWRGSEEPKWSHLVFSDSVVESSTGLVRSAADQSLMRDGLVPYLKMNSVGEMWGYQCVDLPGVRCTSEEFARYELKEGDWLFNTRNSNELVGKSCVWDGPAGVVFNNNLLRVRFKPHIHSMWMEVFFRSPTGRDLLNAIKSATTSVAAIYQRSLMDLQVVVPPPEEQTEIVRRVETLFAFAVRLEARLAQAQTAATRLTPALLAKAFRGELVAQDPNDEPAAELLRRLAQAPAAASPRKGRMPRVQA